MVGILSSKEEKLMINSLNSNLNYDYNTSNFKQDKNIDFKINKHGVAVITGEGALPYRGKKFEYNPKIFGLDESISKKDMQEFNNFMKSNALKDPNKIEKSPLKDFNPAYTKWDPTTEKMMLGFFVSYSKMFHLGYDIIKKADEFYKEFDALISKDLSLNEFKTKYIDFKQRYDEFVKEYEMAMGDKMLLSSDDEIITQQSEKPFKAIQGESKNKETYKDDSTRNELVKKLLEGKFSTSKELELLFGMKFSDDDDDAGEFNKILSLNSTPKSIDIKA
ncbi:TPA: hypothetical protein IED52_001095 [Campylobacter jejuni]|nr:hypothetical protein [Campylobacter jejuni]HAN0547344.1 hypothetical protein [Campylobacter jejuni]HAN0551312.1 hypothetical protein [Campylobacter jejuni]HAN0697054.1 hypothetical protein [Campylobacter jejuni]HAN0721942.1 hypothetical protein [Campylobacter jejuni]